jgi:mediator of RNA polymerase II transcription subunit 18
MELDTMAGILRFTDFPDPPHGKPLLTQRKMVELWEQRAIPSILRDNQYKYDQHFFAVDN